MSDQASGCEGKHGYPSRRDAETSAGRTRRNKGLGLSVYRCCHCWKWHVGVPVSTRRIDRT